MTPVGKNYRSENPFYRMLKILDSLDEVEANKNHRFPKIFNENRDAVLEPSQVGKSLVQNKVQEAHRPNEDTGNTKQRK